jgi:hypothetical protein
MEGQEVRSWDGGVDEGGFLQRAERLDSSDQLGPFLNLKLKKPLKSGHFPIVPAENPSTVEL